MSARAALQRSFAENIMKPTQFKPRSLLICTVALLAATVCGTSAAESIGDHSTATLTLSNMQLQVHALPGNTGPASIIINPSDSYQRLTLWVTNLPASSQYAFGTVDNNPSLSLTSDHARASGTIMDTLLDGTISASGEFQLGQNYFAKAILSSVIFPQLTPFTEVTFSGRVSAQVTGNLIEEGISFAGASLGISLGNQNYGRYINVRNGPQTLDEDFSLTYVNDTANVRDFDWRTSAVVFAPVAEPSQWLMLAFGGCLLGFLRQRTRDAV